MALGRYRSLAKLGRSYLSPSQVGYMILYVTNRCNFRCEFCFYYAEIEKGQKPNELTLQELERLSQSTGPLVQLSLTGGEPFLRRDLDEIYSMFIRNCQARYITIPTNASLPDQMVRFLETVLPRHPDSYLRLTFSVDGIEDDHDTARSMPGSFEKIRQSYAAVSPLRKRFPNLVLDANSVFTSRSEDKLQDTLRYLAENFEFDNLSVTYARGDIRDPSLLASSEERYIQVNDYLESVRRGKEGRFLYPLWRAVRDVSRENLIRTVFHDEFVTPCVAGRKLVVVGETGEVYPCEILDRPMGNLRDHDFNLPQLMAKSENTELRRWIVESQCKCSFECALGANVVWNKSTYPRMLRSAIRNIGKD